MRHKSINISSPVLSRLLPLTFDPIQPGPSIVCYTIKSDTQYAFQSFLQENSLCVPVSLCNITGAARSLATPAIEDDFLFALGLIKPKLLLEYGGGCV